MRSLTNILALVAILLTSNSNAFCEHLYRDFLTGFSDISQYENADHHILIKNQTNLPIFETHAFELNEKNFTYQIRLKTENNNRKYKLLDNDINMQYSIVWNYTNDENYSFLRVSQKEDWANDDILKKRYLLIEIAEISNGDKKDIFTKKMFNKVSYDNEYNSIKIQHHNHKTTFYIGNKELYPIYKTDALSFDTNNKIGYAVSPNSCIRIKRIQFESAPYKTSIGRTDYNKHQLDSLFLESIDPLEGYWTYLDRNMNESKGQLGGKYRIAIVKENKSYKILYISGADMLPYYWEPFMMKGNLLETPFKDHYNLEWINAEKELIIDESYADYTDRILIFHFPKYETKMRFYHE